MNNFLLIFKTQLLAVVNTGKNARRNKKQKAMSLTGYALIWLLLAALAAFYEFIYGAAFAESGMMEAFPVLIVVAASLLTLIGSISYTKSLIFCSKDHDMLFALPVRGSTIVAAKIATLYVLDFIVSFALLLPCGILYGYFAAPPVLFYVRYSVLTLFVPMLPILAAALISALVSLVASRFRHARIVGTVLYIGIFLAFMLGIMSMSSSSEDELAELFSGMVKILNACYPPAAWFTEGIFGDVPMFLLFIGVSAISFAVIALIFGKFYGKIHGAFSVRAVRSKYKMSAASGGAVSALVKKDIKRFFSSPGLMLNQVAGLIMIVVFMVVFLSGGIADSGEEGAQAAKLLSVMFPYLFAMGASMASLTSTSISLEGKAFGLLRSLPVSARTVLSAKLRVHELICFPVVLICSVVMAVLSKSAPVDAVLLIALPLIYSYNAGVLGLLMNLKRYNFDWTSEVMVAKNSMPVMVVTFGGMAASLIPGIVVLFLSIGGISTAITGGVMLVLSLAVSVGLTVLLRSRGEKMFEEIGA